MGKKTNIVNNEWLVTTSRFVGFIDIMGFKDLVARNSHESIYNLMKKINDFQKLNSSIDWGSSNSEKLVKTTTYSDSIMLYSKSDDLRSLYAIICTIAGFCHDLLMEGVPYKGALAYGSMTIDEERSIFFGQPLIDAYLLQEELNFYGFIVHGTAQESIERNIDKLVFVKNYLCPLKNGNSNHLTIHPIYLGTEEYKDENEKLINSLKKMRYTTSGHIRKYIDQTEKYISDVIENRYKKTTHNNVYTK